MIDWMQPEITNKRRFRISADGKLVLQVEQREVVSRMGDGGKWEHGWARSWRDARVEDITLEDAGPPGFEEVVLAAPDEGTFEVTRKV